MLAARASWLQAAQVLRLGQPQLRHAQLAQLIALGAAVHNGRPLLVEKGDAGNRRM